MKSKGKSLVNSSFSIFGVAVVTLGLLGLQAQGAPPEAAKIVFTSSRDGTEQLNVMNTDGSNVNKLTAPPGTSSYAKYSPDGRTIVFQSTREGSLQVYLMKVDGSNIRRLTSPPGANGLPAFSGDGREIAFTSTRDGSRQIYVMDADGSNVKRITSPPGESAAPAFSPDGHKIAFTSDRDGGRQVFVMGADGSNVRRLTSPPGISQDPVFSPDGQTIAFFSNRTGTNQIYVMDTSGGVVRRLTEEPGASGEPAFSPDGKRIAFSSNRDGPFQVYTMNVDGSSPVRITNPPGENFNPSFGPLAALASPATLPEWGPSLNTPGVQLSLEEDHREKASGGTRVYYRLAASGFPKGQVFHFWVWPFGEEVPSSFQRPEITVDEAGKLIVDKRSPLDKSHFVADRYAKGEPFRMGLISTDLTVKALAKAYPFPLEGRDAKCHLWMELMATDGKSFAVYGDGFDPGDHVTTLSTSGSEIVRGESVISNDGALLPVVLLPAVTGKQSGAASFSVASKSCAPTVNYEWGPPAMRVQ